MRKIGILCLFIVAAAYTSVSWARPHFGALQYTIPNWTVYALKNAQFSGNLVTVDAYVVGSYICPHCPPGAECKPCLHESSLEISYEPPSAKGISAVIAEPSPEVFKIGGRYRFDITTWRHGEFVGRVTGWKPI